LGEPTTERFTYGFQRTVGSYRSEPSRICQIQQGQSKIDKIRKPYIQAGFFSVYDFASPLSPQLVVSLHLGFGCGAGEHGEYKQVPCVALGIRFAPSAHSYF
jgi:hypothetical protein